MFKVGDYALTPAGKRLQVRAVISAPGFTDRVLLSDGGVYNTSVLRPAN